MKKEDFIHIEDSSFVSDEAKVAASDYAKRGWAVIPCAAGGKTPLTKRGYKDGTKDQSVIRKWSSAVNIAIVTGLVSGLLILDIDPRNGGNETLASLIEEHGEIPKTVTVSTGGGGKHYYFRLPPGVAEVKTTLGPGVDVLGGGGYAMAPPSRHPSGGIYRFDDGLSPGDVDLADVPDWILTRTRRPAVASTLMTESAEGHAPQCEIPLAERRRRASLYLSKMDGAVSGDGGHAQTFKAAVALVRGFMLPQTEARELLGEYNIRCTPPWNDRELDHKIEQAFDNSYKEWGYLLGDRSGWGEWRKSLKVTSKGAIKPLFFNAFAIVTNTPEYQDLVGFDEFSQKVMLLRSEPRLGLLCESGTPRQWTEADDKRVCLWLQENWADFSPTIIPDVIAILARDNPFHPVKNYLNGLVWDGIPRLDTWLPIYLGCDNNEYTRLVGAKYMIAAVARIFQPGCKADNVLILEGAQGLKKSTALKTLADPWFTDELPDLGSKDAPIQLQGKWIIEIAELDTLSRAEVSAIKAFFSRSTDRFRPPYGRYAEDFPRQCVLAGTVNQSEYLKDETGNRRFWPVLCCSIDIDGLADVRDQLWAEAMFRYHGGEGWWLDGTENALAEDEQASRLVTDPWLIHVLAFAADQAEVRVEEVLTHLGVTKDRATQSDKNRVARCLQQLEYERKQVRVSGTKVKVWVYRRKTLSPVAPV